MDCFRGSLRRINTMDHNTGMTTLGKVADRAAYLASECYDEFVPVADISFPEGLSTISIAGERRLLLETAQRQIANRLSIPFPYLQRCPEDLQAENLAHWITEERNEKLFFRFDGAHVRAIFTPRYRPLNDLQLIERLFDLGYDHHTPVQARLDAAFMSISIPDSRMIFDLDGNGDRVKPGLCFANSEVGLSSVFVTAFMLRLVCTNGMLAKTSASTSKRHISTTILDDFPSMAEAASKQLSSMAHQFQISRASKVEDPEAIFTALNRQYQVGEEEAKAVEWGFHQESGNSMFLIIQAYTRAPQFPGLSAHSCHKLERVGGQILSTVRREAA
jgi:hypothetical protein